MQKGRVEELLIAEEKYLMIIDVLKSFKTLDQSQFNMLKRLFTDYVDESEEAEEETSKQKQSKAKQTTQ
jgi:hypothetical protein